MCSVALSSSEQEEEGSQERNTGSVLAVGVLHTAPHWASTCWSAAMKHISAILLLQLFCCLHRAASETTIIGEYYDGHVAKAWVNIEKQTHGPQPVSDS
jgi:hypothetical protein